ncbi:MAG: metabolite traffic protein EboE [Planctomycetaceae bacterium]
MSLSSLPLSYCTNVHPGRTIAEVEHGLDQFTVNLRRNFGAPLAAGLWLADPVIRELKASPGNVQRFADGLRARDLTCHTLNAFPYGDFHSPRVKENVYLPDWTAPNRAAYTLGCAEILAALLPEGVEGSISTVPLGFKGFTHPSDFLDRAADALIDVAESFEQLKSETGRHITLAIEPEPMCVLETTPEAINFFEEVFRRAADRGGRALSAARDHLGLCYDVCHQSVEFEDVAASIAAISDAGIRIGKVHITCAIQLDNPAENREGRRLLARYAEPRYLHQTLARSRTGEIHRVVDLDEQTALEPEPEFRDAESWRIHFHVPVNAEHLGPLGTTRPDLERALAAVAKLPYAPHLEVETYTWQVLPDGSSTSLVDGLTQELTATRKLLSSLPS